MGDFWQELRESVLLLLTAMEGRVKITSLLPPSSRGLGHSPLKAKTGVRVPVGAQILKNRSVDDVERFLSMLRFDSREKLDQLNLEMDAVPNNMKKMSS